MLPIPALVLLTCCGSPLSSGLWQADENQVYVLTKPEHTWEEIEKAYAEMPQVAFTPPADRWKRLPRTARILRSGKGELRIVMLGDSIVNDTSRSRWDEMLAKQYPGVQITRTTVVRGGTGCWWYREPGRVERYVLPYKPDLLIIGGISHHDDIDAIRDVIKQVRSKQPCDVLLVSPVLGTVDPRDDKQWTEKPARADFRAKLGALADELKIGWFDETAAWGKYIRDSGHELAWFHRDEVHANIRGEQLIGRLLAAYLSPPLR